MSGQLQTKKIAKNTILLYFRMLLGVVVSLYTSRIVLQVLGIDDFGIYNIVGGVIVMFSFINTFLTNACQRFLSYSLAKNSIEETKKIFSTSLFIHFIVLLLFASVCETFGLYFVKEKLVIPHERLSAALFVFQIMVIESCISIFKVPYNAAIIAEEKMDFYAYTSIAENLLRLVLIYLLLIVPFDKLELYASLHLFVSALMLLWYKIYAEHKFNYCTSSLKYDKIYLKSMVSFSGWNLFGSIADIGYKQGTNIILNLFYGVALNAAMGIATTVRSTVFSFINNIHVAANPQIVKSYAVNELSYYNNLLCKISKYSYFLMLFLAIPIIINIQFILELWLGDVPAYSASLIVLGLIFCLIDCLHGPLWTSMQATGTIKKYQLITSLVLLLNLPLSYWALRLGYSPNSIMVVQIIVSAATLIVRLLFSCNYAQVNLLEYVKQVIIPVITVSIIAVPVPMFIGMHYDASWNKLIVTGIVSVFSVIISVFFAGMSKAEKDAAIQVIRKRIKQ